MVVQSTCVSCTEIEENQLREHGQARIGPEFSARFSGSCGDHQNNGTLSSVSDSSSGRLTRLDIPTGLQYRAM